MALAAQDIPFPCLQTHPFHAFFVRIERICQRFTGELEEKYHCNTWLVKRSWTREQHRLTPKRGFEARRSANLLWQIPGYGMSLQASQGQKIRKGVPVFHAERGKLTQEGHWTREFSGVHETLPEDFGAPSVVGRSHLEVFPFHGVSGSLARWACGTRSEGQQRLKPRNR